ncbi:MAG: SrtB family sortase [Firmicutes bacterium HGW-Firmicutes-16]|nr:MAG: SrtB family sortase [Firmicutes bacterium HGW-Firmicutes-16]
MNKILRSVLIVVLSAVLIWSLARIGLTVGDYKTADAIYEKSRNESFHITESTPEVPVSNISEEYFPEVSVDFESLTKTNPDVVGWLYIPDTDINFPLLRAADNWKYLSLSYNLQSTNSGSIFMDFRNSVDLSDDNTLIYGHNMKSGGMFGKLKEFGVSDYLTEHPDFYVFTETQVFKYRIFSAYKTQADSPSYTLSFSEDPDYKGFIDYIKDCTGENITDTPEENTPLITLSTCTSGQRSGRFVVHAYLVASNVMEGTSLENKKE